MRIVVTGASGFLGAYLLESLSLAGHSVAAWSGRESGHRAGIALEPIDLTDPAEVVRRLDSADPAVIVHLAAISASGAVLRDPPAARSLNVEATGLLASWCRDRGRRLVFTSTDLVFSGGRPWSREGDPAEPILLYGRTKREAERAVVAGPGGLVARMPLLYGPSLCGRAGFFDSAIADIRSGRPRTFFSDEFRTPLDYPTAARILARLLGSEVCGTLHVAGVERVSRLDLMRRAAVAMGLDASLVCGGLRTDAPGPEPRPADVSLDTTRLLETFPGLHRPTIEEAASGWSS